jgi:hypothetical protein
MTPRQSALAKMLEDWEAGRNTSYGSLPPLERKTLNRDGLIASLLDRGFVCLTPTGLAAARSARDGARDE